MGSISQRSCHAYLLSVKYTTAWKSSRRRREGERGERERERRNDYEDRGEKQAGERKRGIAFIRISSFLKTSAEVEYICIYIYNKDN